MEDPNSRPPAAQLINEVIREHEDAQLLGVFRAGNSLAMKVYRALKEAGYLQDGA
jgi:hypothetical protein